MSLFLLRYGELGLKAPGTRRRYEQKLADNLLQRLALAGIEAAAGIGAMPEVGTP